MAKGKGSRRMKTIKMSDEIHRGLSKILGELMAENGKPKTYEDVIKYLLSLREKRGKGGGIFTDNVATKGEGRVGPFIAGLYTAAVRGGEAAEKILREEGDKLTPEQKAYLEHVIEEGKRARKFLEEHGIKV
ncbi:MAG: hypothetical protein QXG35_06545 [Nitrososphaerota archaeon]